MKQAYSFLIAVLISGLSFGSITAGAQDDCTGYRTQTPGGWGSKAKGNNPGAYRNAHFNQAFPAGLVVGCEINTLTLSTSQDVEDFLPCGGPSAAITQDYLNPNCIQNVFAGHLVAATLSVYFDLNDEGFSEATGNLGDLEIASGPFQGLTVYAFLEIANDVFGGCSNAYTPGAVKNALASINENFVDGNGDNGFLICVEECPDTEAPVATYEPADLWLDCSENIPFDAPVFSDEDSDLDIDYNQIQTGEGCEYVITRTWVATDDCGNSTTVTQYIYVSDNNAPYFLWFPADASYECDENISVDIPEATDACSNVEVTYEDEFIFTDCASEYTILRTFTCTDECGLSYSQTQTITISDTTAPSLSELPASVVLACGEELPAAPEVTATDNCDEMVDVQYSEITLGDGGNGTCTLTTPIMNNPEWAIVLFGMPNGSDYYLVQTGSFVQNPDMTAHVTATLVSSVNPNAGWNLNLHLIDGLNWNDWSNQAFPTDYKDDLNLAGDNYLDWLYYIIDGASSSLTGWGDYAGSNLTITHLPNSHYYGYQVGIAANNVSANFGHGGWMTVSGNFVDASQGIDQQLTVTGDFAFEQSCCDDPSVQRTWTATDCAGNSVQHVQVISFSDQVFPGIQARSETHLMAESNVYPNPFSEVLNLNFSEAQEQIDVTVYAVSGAIVAAYQLNGSDRLEMNLGGLETGVYILQVNSTSGISVHRLIKQ